MSEKQWVQYKNDPQGEKWEVRDGVTAENTWCVVAKNEHDGYHWLPKSEYRLCDPPEVWKDVTELCYVDKYGAIIHEGRTTQEIPYRRRKVEVNLIGPNYQYGCKKAWAFIVEQKVTE